MSCDVKISKKTGVSLVGISDKGRMYEAKDKKSAFYLKTCYELVLKGPQNFKQSVLIDALNKLQKLYEDQEINYTAYIVIQACINKVSKESKTKNFNTASSVKIWDFDALLESARGNGFKSVGTHQR